MQRGAAAVVCQCGGVGGQLHRRHSGVCLADGGLQRQPGGIIFVGGPGQLPGGRRHLHTGIGGKTQCLCSGGKPVHPQPAAHVIEKDVAAVFQGGEQVDPSAVADLQAAGLVVGVVEIPAGAVHRVLGGNQPGGKGGCRHCRLEGRPGRIQALDGAVKQRGSGVGCQRRIVAAVVRQIKGRLVGGCQNTTGFGVHHHNRPGAGFPAGPGRLGGAQRFQVVRQRLLDCPLQIGIQCQLKDGTRFRSLGQLLLQDALAARRHQHAAVSAMQKLLIGGFQPALADLGVHGNAAACQLLPLFGGDGPHRAQRMGQQGAVRPAAHARRG